MQYYGKFLKIQEFENIKDVVGENYIDSRLFKIT